MDVSVIIVTRNTCALTCDAIRSVLDSRDGLATEVFVVDNGSTDETPKLLPERFPAVRYRRFENNLGFAKAVNLAAREARGEFLLLLNSDARVGVDSLATAVAWMRAHPECGVAGAQLLHPDSRRQNSIANFPTLATELLNKSLLRRLWPERYPGKEHVFTEPVEVESVIGAFFLVRKKLWDELGGLDERFFFILEETDFCLQAQRTGSRVMHLPQVEVWHGQGQSAKHMPTEARIEYWRSRYLYFAKNQSGLSRIIVMAGLGTRLFFDWLAATLLVLLTFGRNGRWRSRWRVCTALAGWHLRGCPAKAGLPR
jgi:GT2 family glycosyltransferase